MSKKLLKLILSNAGCPDSTQYTGSGPMNATFDIDQGLVIRSVTLHCVGQPGAAEDFVIKHKLPGQSPAFDVTRLQQPMQGVTDVVLTDPIFVSKGDVITFEWPNGDNVQWGLNVIHGRNA